MASTASLLIGEEVAKPQLVLNIDRRIENALRNLDGNEQHVNVGRTIGEKIDVTEIPTLVRIECSNGLDMHSGYFGLGVLLGVYEKLYETGLRYDEVPAFIGTNQIEFRYRKEEPKDVHGFPLKVKLEFACGDWSSEYVPKH